MPMNKPHLEFHRLDMNTGWSTPEGYPAGIEQKILAGDLDERRKMGSRTRLLRFDPGVYTVAPFVHDLPAADRWGSFAPCCWGGAVCGSACSKRVPRRRKIRARRPPTLHEARGRVM
jgi:hypothetical protein